MLRADLISAFMLLTRIPVGRFARDNNAPDLARCIWAFPLVGIVVNGTGGLVYWLAHRVGMPSLLAATWTLAASISLTGALHEDGLADTADGFGGGATRTRKLAIMRDSRIGSYGALALVLTISSRMAAIAALDKPAAVMTASVLAGMVGRAAILLPLRLLAPAREDGMGASVAAPKSGFVALALGTATLAALALFPTLQAIAAIGLGFGSSLAFARFVGAQIGGYTGDILGATEVIVECVVLTALASG